MNSFIKRLWILLVLLTSISGLSFAEAIAEESSRAEKSADVSYAFGMVLGADLKQTGVKFNYEALLRGFRESVEGKENRFPMDQAISMVQSAVRDAMMEQAEFNRQQEEEFLRGNSLREGIVSTPSGLQYEVIDNGSGEKPKVSDRVRVNYKGALIDGTVFDSSYDRDESAEFPLNAVIPGWSEGIQLMTVGAHYRLYIPSRLAYGEGGAGGVIPPNSTLVFDVELLEILANESDGPLEDDEQESPRAAD